MTKRAPRNRTSQSWLIYRIKGTPAELVSIVDAPDERTALRKVIKEHKVTNGEQRKRLIAQRRD